MFTLERAFNLDTSIVCIFPDKDGEHLIESRKVQCRELFLEEVDLALKGLEGPSSLATIEFACSWARTLSGTMFGVHWHVNKSRTDQQRSVVAHCSSKACRHKKRMILLRTGQKSQQTFRNSTCTVFLSKDNDLCTESNKVQFRH